MDRVFSDDISTVRKRAELPDALVGLWVLRGVTAGRIEDRLMDGRYVIGLLDSLRVWDLDENDVLFDDPELLKLTVEARVRGG